MVRKAKRNYSNNLNISNIIDNKQFWKTVKPCFSSTFGDNERINLTEVEKLVSEGREVTKTFKSYFETIAKNLGINSKFMYEDPVSNESVNDVIRKFQNHPSIIKIKENHQRHFSFSAVEVEDIDRKIHLLDASKTIQQNDIPVKIIKANRDIFSVFIMHSFNKDISTARFPDILKMQRLNQFKEKSRIDKENYILPVSLHFSILPVISKICERLIFKQLIMFF